MGLNIYPGSVNSGAFSQDGDNTNPIRFSVDGRVGGVMERLYYVGNDNPGKSYSAIVLTPTPNVAMDIVNGVDGYSIKLFAGSTQPTSQHWDTITPGHSVSISNITDTLTFMPFWIRIEIPKGAPVDTITNTSIDISCTETAV